MVLGKRDGEPQKEREIERERERKKKERERDGQKERERAIGRDAAVLYENGRYNADRCRKC